MFRWKRFLISYALAAAMVSGFVLETVGLAARWAEKRLQARLPGEFPQPPPWTGPARPFIKLKDTTPTVEGEPAAPPPPKAEGAPMPLGPGEPVPVGPAGPDGRAAPLRPGRD